VIEANLIKRSSHRPHQVDVHIKNETPMSCKGDGWDAIAGEGWFNNNPPESKRRATTAMEPEENLILMQTMTHVRFNESESGGK